MKSISILFLLNALFVSSGFAAECEIEGMKNPPQSMNCEFRDGWYIKTFYDITCVNGRYVYSVSTRRIPDFETGTIVSAFSKVNSNGKTELHFINQDEKELVLDHRLGKLYRGFFTFPDWGSYDSKTHCRVP